MIDRIITADLNGRTDGAYYNFLQRINSKLPIVLLSRVEDLVINPQVYELKNKKFIVVDVIENGWDVNFNNTLVVGEDLFGYDFLKGDWSKLHLFLNENKPSLYFKRELVKQDATDWLIPCEYPNWQNDYQLQTKAEFNNRAINVFNYWGRSHEARLLLHGEIWEHAAKKGYTVCDNIYQFNDFMHHEKENKNKWITLHMPHYGRIPIHEIMKINAISKLSISLFGCGRKCFRNTGESIVNSICVLPEDNLAYSKEFIHGVNCIKFSINDDVTGLKNEWNVCETIDEALNRNDLYDIYLESKKLADWYRIDNYTKYFENKINNA